jgi:hypothetical protein
MFITQNEQLLCLYFPAIITRFRDTRRAGRTDT